MKAEDARTLTWLGSIVLVTLSALMIFGQWPAVLAFGLLVYVSVVRK